MKKIAGFLLLVIVIAAGIASCKKIIKAIFPGLDVDIPAITLTLPTIPFAPPNEVRIATFTQHFNLDSMIKVQTNGTFSSADVTSVKVKEIVFTLSNADERNNLSNFESARFTFFSNTKAEPAEIASVTFPDAYADTYKYIATAAPELRPYLSGTQLSYDVYGKLRRTTTKPVTLTVRVTLRVE